MQVAKAAQPDVEQLTREMSIQRLAEARGIRLVRRGSMLVGSCPFHRSVKLMLTINAKNNTWSCSGLCKVTSATAIEWTMRAEGISRKHAIEFLRSGSITAPTKTGKAPKKGTVR